MQNIYHIDSIKDWNKLKGVDLSSEDSVVIRYDNAKIDSTTPCEPTYSIFSGFCEVTADRHVVASGCSNVSVSVGSVTAKMHATVRALNKSCVTAHGDSTVFAYDQTVVYAHDYAHVVSHMSTSLKSPHGVVYAHNYARVEATRAGVITAFDNSMVILHTDSAWCPRVDLHDYSQLVVDKNSERTVKLFASDYSRVIAPFELKIIPWGAGVASSSVILTGKGK